MYHFGCLRRKSLLEIVLSKEYFLALLLVVAAGNISAQNNAAPPRDSLIRFVPDSTLPVAFGWQRPGEMVQSYSAVNGSDLTNVPVSSILGALYGRLPGLQLRQATGAPGSDAPNESLRGLTPLVIIDGVPRDFTMIDLYQVASVAVLKDAVATALYGQRGAGGALLITTKRGGAGKARISFTAQTASLKSVTQPKLLDAYNYALLFNEGLLNAGQQPVYTADDLSAYKNHSDPFGHPDVDWYSTAFKDKTQLQQYNLNISGGSNTARYFVDLDYLNQGGVLNVPNDVNTYPTTNYYKRYNFRTNLDVALTKTTQVGINIYGRLQNGNQPGAGMDSIYNSVMLTPGNAYPQFNPDGSLGGNSQYRGNIWGLMAKSGYIPSYNRTMGMDLSVKQDLTFLKGLYAVAKGSFISYYNESTLRTKSIEVYDMNIDPATGDTIYTKFGNTGTQTNTMSVGARDRQIYYTLGLGYDAAFNASKLHADLLYNNDNYVNGSDLPVTNRGILGRAEFSLKEKYLLEAVASYSGLNRFAKGKEWGLFPAMGIGWNISKESWFSSSVFNDLKIRSTYGLTGNNLSAGYFAYQQFYNSGATFYKGNAPASSNTMVEGTLANPDLTWEKAKKFNVGTDIAIAKNRVHFTADYFNNLIYDALIIREANAGGLLGANRPLENLGRYSYKGYEFSLGYNDHTRNASWYVTGNAALLNTKIIDITEAAWPETYLYRTGRPLGQPFGLVAEGFYQNTEEISNGPVVEGYSPQPGDLKYKDLNGDHIINALDKTALTSGKPVVNYGLNYGFQWKGFDISMLWQGVMNVYTFTNSMNTLGFQIYQSGYSQAFESNLGRWTPETAATATFPRITLGYNTNNYQNSSFWLKRSDYLRLKYAEIGYALPATVINRIKLKQARVFVNATNLLTVSKFRNWDPEYSDWAYPNQRTVSAGVNIQF